MENIAVSRRNRRLQRFLKPFKRLGKNHLDFLTALLSIPVLLSVIILNYNNLRKPGDVPTPTPVQRPVIVLPTGNTNPTPSASCKKDIGPISISSPQEGETVNDNPVCFTIRYDDANYCSVVWSYRVNNGSWSAFTSNNPCIYNLPNGNVKFDLRVQSTVSQKEASLTRNFVYKNSNPSATSSAQQQF
jgi:hypothetical protein